MNRKKLLLALALVVAMAVCVGAVWATTQSVPKVANTKTGVTVLSNAKAAVDTSNLAEGYLQVKYTGGKSVRVRVGITKQGGEAYLYDLNNKGTVETFPLTEGDGSYTVKVYENTTGTKYAAAYTTTVKLALRSPLLPFLYPNQFVSYTDKSKVVTQGETLTKGLKTPLEKVSAIYRYVVDHFTYDTKLAETVESGYLPVVDTVLEKKTGICFDYAAVMAAMLRSQQIPCKLVVGYAGTIYHAWISVYLEDTGWVDGLIYFDGTSWTMMDPTFASSGKGDKTVNKFITDNKNYTQKFVY